MLFHSSSFVPLFAVFVVIFHLFNWSRSMKALLILAASLIFYWQQDPQALPLLIIVMGLHYGAGRFQGLSRKTILGSVITIDVLILSYFKFVAPPAQFPFGISFYIFQCIAYLIDTLDRQEDPIGPLDFFTSVSYFPHLPAGPLLKTSKIVQSLGQDVTWEDCQKGFFYFSLGMLKKTVADLLIPLTTNYLTNGSSSALEAWTGALAALARVYGDFSGYTDMAWGLSFFLGIKLPLNFFRPFTATSIREYYSERWHISLGQWIRNYLFLPLGLALGRRGISSHVTLILTFIIMGLWHGPKANFPAWGLYVALLIILSDQISTSLPRWLAILRTNALVMVGLIVFFSRDLSTAWLNCTNLLVGGWSTTPTIVTEALLCLGGLVAVVVLSFLDELSLPRFLKRPALFWSLVVLFVFLAKSFGPTAKSFIYFDF